jgi:prevent-host-death family protein
VKKVNIHEAKTHFSALIADVQNGEDVVIAKAGKPVAKLSGAREALGARPMGYDVGLEYWIAPDFDAYVPEEFEKYTS